MVDNPNILAPCQASQYPMIETVLARLSTATPLLAGTDPSIEEGETKNSGGVIQSHTRITVLSLSMSALMAVVVKRNIRTVLDQTCQEWILSIAL